MPGGIMQLNFRFRDSGSEIISSLVEVLVCAIPIGLILSQMLAYHDQSQTNVANET